MTQIKINPTIDSSRVPKHVAIVMDGNGRWAKARGLERAAGHQEGIASVHEIAEVAAHMGIDYLTLYTFSTENWNRPAEEVNALMGLLMEELNEKLFKKNQLRFEVIGDIKRLPIEIQDQITYLRKATSQYKNMTLVLALSYSSRWEITYAMQQIAQEIASGDLLPEEVNESCINAHMNTSFMPDPDLLIRTGGDIRLSNYLLWQSAYTEFYFCNIFWPDFRQKQFEDAILDYQTRERRFGKTSEQVQNENSAQ